MLFSRGAPFIRLVLVLENGCLLYVISCSILLKPGEVCWIKSFCYRLQGSMRQRVLEAVLVFMTEITTERNDCKVHQIIFQILYPKKSAPYHFCDSLIAEK